MIFYWNMNDEIEIYEDGYIESQPNKDVLAEIAVEIVMEGYEGIVIHQYPLRNGETFMGINFREDTIEGALFAEICDAFGLEMKIPRPENVARFIKLAYQSLESEA